MSKRAQRKKLQKKYKVGDRITWGTGAVYHEVVKVLPTGVVVDVSSQEAAKYFAQLQPDGRYFLFVAFDHNNRNRSGRGPIKHQGE